MKKVDLLVASNRWEYSNKVSVSFKKSYSEKFSAQDPFIRFVDSEGNPAPNILVLDGEYEITFDEGFEVLK